MQRYDTKLEDGAFFVEWDEEWLEIGEMAALRDLFGGDTYEIEYDQTQSKAPWLENALEDQTLSFDVTETLVDMDFDAEFVADVAQEPIEETGPRGYPVRTEVFAEKMIEIWDAQGRQDDEV
ncbi:hypothetical protein [Halorhabdus amylolytica]|uniref:hypothetical protein n=1 Tax=Halorhabdus amylolytica TaxID=2559573 RepID=UPI0010AB46E1|nr:hypothetical protein [Halorhabdus amylolytica]